MAATVSNVVATANLNCHLDLQRISEILPLTQYIPQRFSGLLLRMFHPFKAHCQLYRNGKITVNGAKSVRGARALTRRFAKQLARIGYRCVVTNFKVVNMVATCNFHRRLNSG